MGIITIAFENVCASRSNQGCLEVTKCPFESPFVILFSYESLFVCYVMNSLCLIFLRSYDVGKGPPKVLRSGFFFH